MPLHQATAPLRLQALLRESRSRAALSTQETERVPSMPRPGSTTEPLRLETAQPRINNRTKTADLVRVSVARYRVIHGHLPAVILLSAVRYLEMTNQGVKGYQGVPFGFERWADYEILLRGKE